MSLNDGSRSPRRQRLGDDGSDGLSASRVVNWVIGGIIAALLVVNGLTWLRGGSGTGGPMVGQQAPDIPLPTLSAAVAADTQNRVSLQDLRGKVVLVDFWKTWCKPCHRQMAEMVKLQARDLPADVIIYSVNIDDPGPNRLRKVRAIVDRFELQATTVIDDGRAQRAFNVTSFPTLVLVGPDGIVKRRSSGVHPVGILAGWIRQAADAT